MSQLQMVCRCILLADLVCPPQILRSDIAFARVCREPTLKYALRALPGVVPLPNPEVCVGDGGWQTEQNSARKFHRSKARQQSKLHVNPHPLFATHGIQSLHPPCCLSIFHRSPSQLLQRKGERAFHTIAGLP